MKTLLAIFLALAFGSNGNTLSDKLCRENEEVVFSFVLAKSQKIVSICKDKDDKYIVYRFGTKDKVELTFPKSLTKNSWKNFSYYSIHRSGGKKNAAFGDINLSFTNEGVGYKVYHYWREEEGLNQIGIEIKSNGKEIILKGDLKSKIGALQELDHLSELIDNNAED